MHTIPPLLNYRRIPLFTFLLLILLVPPLVGQVNTDSLKAVINGSAHDSLKLAAYDALTYELATTDSLLTIQYIEQGVALAKESGREDYESILQLNRSNLMLEKSHYQQSNDIIEVVLAVPLSENQNRISAKALYLLGKTEYLQGNYEEAIAQYKKGAEIEKTDETSNFYSLRGLGDAHFRLGNYDTALSYFDQCLEYYQNSNNNIGLYHTYFSIAAIYNRIRKPTIAISKFEEGLNIAETIHNKTLIASSLSNLGAIYVEQGELNKGSYYFDRAIKINKDLDNKLEVGKNLIYLSELYKKKGEYDQSIAYLQQSIDIFDKIGHEKFKIISLSSIGINYIDQNMPEQALVYFEQSLRLIEKAKNPLSLLLARSYFLVGYSHLLSNNEDSAFHHFDKAFIIIEKTKNWRTLQDYYYNIVNWYKKQGQLNKTLLFFEKSLDLSARTGDTLGMIRANIQIAAIYEMQKSFESAFNYQKKAMDFAQQINDQSSIAQTQVALGNILVKQAEYDQALRYSFLALQNFQAVKDSCNFSHCFQNIGHAYYAQNQIDSAFHYLSLGKNQSDKCAADKVSANITLLLGKVYEAKGFSKLSFNAYKEALSLAKKSQDRTIIMKVAEALYPIYQQNGQWASAFATLDLYHTNKDSILNVDNTRKLAERELQQQKAEQALQLQQKEAAQRAQNQRQRWINITALLAFLTLFVVFYAYYRNYRNKQKANILLNEQNAKISQQKADLEQLDEAKSRLFANISHELRTPLTLISSPVQQLLSKEQEHLTPHQMEYLQLVKRNTKQLKGLVNDILDLSKLESNQLSLQESSLAIVPFLRRVFSNFNSLAEHLGIQYHLRTDLPKNSYAVLDSHNVEKILNNLLSNAIKHTPSGSGGEVRLTAHQKDDQLFIQVSDTGQGIAKEDLPHIFDRFFQSKNEHASLQGGTGIGLALAKELTQLMNGELSVSSQFGKGSSFSLILPYEAAEAPFPAKTETETELTQQSSSFAPPLTGGKQYRILIVEDHPDMQRFVQQLLSPYYETLVANHGKQALEVLKKEPIDLIVSDVMMPEMDGYALLEALKDHPTHYQIPVVILTALADEEHKLQALNIGVDDYLSKPFSPEELMARIHNLLERYEVRRELAQEIQKETIKLEGAGVVVEEVVQEVGIRQKETEWLKNIEGIIRRELENPDFNISTLADQFFLSERQFRRRVKQLTGLSPKKFQQEVALQEARKLLERKAYGSVKAIGYTIGMNNVSRFSQLYEARFGKKPNDYF